MEPKKSFRANLERSRPIFFQIGCVVSLALVLVGFEWNQEAKSRPTIYHSSLPKSDVTDVPPSVSPPEEAVLPLEVPVILNLVPDNTNLQDNLQIFDNTSVDENTSFTIQVPETPEEPVDEPFVNPQFPPDFQGEGIIGFWKWVQKNITYPREAIELNLQGTVYVEFIVNKEGQVSKARVVKGVDPLLDAEALRTVLSSPRWTPGMQGINKVSVRFTIPVTFLLKN